MDRHKDTFTKKVSVKKCPHCNRQIRPASKFCSFCGQSVVSQLQKEPIFAHEKKVEVKKDILPIITNKKKTEVKKDILPIITHEKKAEVKKDILPEEKTISLKLPEPVILCPYCQAPLSETELFCSKCHRTLKKCSLCNKINRGIARFCRSCQGAFPSDIIDWQSFRGNNFRSGFSEEKLDFPMYFQWTYPGFDDSIGSLWASPVVSRDKIYVPSKEKNIYVFNQFTGELLWKQPASGYIFTTPAVDDKYIYMGCDDGKVFAIESEKGGVKWFYDAETEIGSAIIASDDKIFVPLKEGRILVLNSAKDGSMVWCFPHRKYAPLREIVSSPSLAGDILIFSSTSKMVYALSARDGKLLWKYEMKSPVISSPAIKDNIAYIVDRGGAMAALNINTGKDSWAGLVDLPGPFSASPAVKDELVVVASQRGFLYALEPRTGGIKWEKNFNSSNYFEAINSSPVLTKDNIILGTDGGSVYILEQAGGNVVWQFKTNSWVWSSPAVSKGYVYITSNDGHIYAFSSKKPDIHPGFMKVF